MPTYEYRCQVCQHQFEEIQKITADPLQKCPKCGKAGLVRGPGGGIGLQFQGTGFYITDYGPGKSSEEKKSCKNKGAAEGGGGCCPCGKNPS